MRRGALRVLLGAAPGVGKTYEMLEEGRRLQAEETSALFQAMHQGGAYIRIRFGGGDPSLPPPIADPGPPPPPPEPDRDDGFYRDEDGPEWGA